MMRVFRVSAMLWAIVVFAVGGRSSRAQQAAGRRKRISICRSLLRRRRSRHCAYLLLPELKEMQPGNPIEGYLKCYLDQYRFTFDAERFERRETLLSMPLDELPAPDVRELGRFALEEADRAARLDNPDWQILLKLKSDGFGTLLPDLQALRTVARAMQARFRTEVAGGRIDDAVRTAKSLFAMARHMGEHPTLIGDLVGIANANMAISPLEEMVQRPECPNLYWALSNLPDPLISIKKGMDGERLIMWSVFRDLSPTAPMSAEQIKGFVDPMDRLLNDSGQNKAPRAIQAYIAAQTKDDRKVAAARRRLVESGLLEPNVKAFPAEQVILLDEARECQARFDEIVKNIFFPAWQFECSCEKFIAAKREQAFFADNLLPMPSLLTARRAQGRLEQRIALLRHVEALRMHAAEHGGAFPAKLSDISVPLPVDPFSGKPFLYEANGKTAHVRGTPPDSEKDKAPFRVHYEITPESLVNEPGVLRDDTNFAGFRGDCRTLARLRGARDAGPAPGAADGRACAGAQVSALAPLDELNPGNAAQNYLKCFMEQHHFFFGKQGVAERDRYRVDAARRAGRGEANAVRRQRTAAGGLGGQDGEPRLAEPGEHPERRAWRHRLRRWGRFRFWRRRSMFDFAPRLPSASSMTPSAPPRRCSPSRATWASTPPRWRISSASGLPTSALNTLEEMVQQANCPNLYWALTDLPSPLVDLRKGVQGEQTMIAAELRAIREDCADDRIGAGSDRQPALGRDRLFAGTVRPAAAKRTAGPARLGERRRRACAARRRLVEAGCHEETAGTLPAAADHLARPEAPV